MPTDSETVPYVPRAADLVRHADYLVRRAAADEAPLIGPDDLAFVLGLTQSVRADELALPSACSQLATVALVALFRRGRASLHNIATQHAATIWTAQYRVACEGVDGWAESRADLLRIFERMALDVHLGRGYAMDPIADETFGERLIRLRDRAGLTQAELARSLGTSASALRNWEGGRYFPQLALFRQLCRALRCSYDELLGPR